MSKQVLQMKYHPAKKEVKFHRFQNGKDIPIRRDSKLIAYMNRRGSFVLQDQGNIFLKDIVATFDGEKTVKIEVITTKNDYEDFEQMVEYYNTANPTVKININLLSELPDMDETYRAVKEHGKNSLTILETHRKKFFDVLSNNSPDRVKECVTNFSVDVQTEIDSIKEKIIAIAENNVNLCFAGVYSAGKSALINAILGYAILPEAIKSETARMFRIQSPKTGEHIRITFLVRADFTELVWNAHNNVFEFAAGPVENVTRELIQDTIYKNTSKAQHTQIQEILKTLNTNDDVSSEILVYFPIPLDNDKVQFTIFDTPGTDSNYGEHQVVLKDALSEQTHSILIFVAAPNKTEGEGSNALLNYLKEAEKKDSKTSIDIGRSLFVINWADSITPDDRIALQTAELKDKEDDEFSIRLSDKKLFFTSAKVAYAAKAKMNDVATKNDEFTIKQQTGTINDEQFGRYYQQNRCATSEYATKKIIDASTFALEEAESIKDDLSVLHICSGVFALENEIVLYGEKFATAVRAFAIIDSVDKALSKMNTNANSLEKQNQHDIDEINQEIVDLRTAISESIKKAYAEHTVSKNTSLPEDVLFKLHLDSPNLNKTINGKAKEDIEKLLHGRFLGLGKVKFNETHKKEISQIIIAILDNFTRTFLTERQMLLKDKQNAFIDTVTRIIRENGSVSEEAKNFILDIRPPEVKKALNIEEFGELYDNYKRSGKFLWINTEHIEKDKFMDVLEQKLSDIANSLATDFARDYRSTLTSMLSTIESEFVQNLEKYSVLMKAKLDDKKAMEELRNKILTVADELRLCQQDLEKIIWSLKNNE